jgi:hypothetical protein
MPLERVAGRFWLSFRRVAGSSGILLDIVTAGRQDPTLDGSEFFVREVTLTPHFFVQKQQFFRIGGILGRIFVKTGPNPEANQQKGCKDAEEHGHCRQE